MLRDLVKVLAIKNLFCLLAGLLKLFEINALSFNCDFMVIIIMYNSRKT